MWRPRLPIRMGYSPTNHLNLITTRIQVATIRRVAYFEDPKETAPPKFPYDQRPKLDSYRNGPSCPSPFNDGNTMWFPDTSVDRTPNELRRLINRLIDSGEITVRGFCDMIRVSSTSYNCFMGQNGKWDGKKTATYARGLHYFQQREEAGVGISRKPATKAKAHTAKSKFAIIPLDGQTLDSVPVYNTCQGIRRKINIHMRQPGVTPKAFLQHLSAQFYLTPTKIKNSHLEKFRGAQGFNFENTNPVFYAAYVFFEKIRVGSGKAKSQLRERIERLHQETGGMNTKTPCDKNGSWIRTQSQGSTVSVDKYGITETWDPSSRLYGQHGPLTSDQRLLYDFYRQQD